MRSRTSGAAVPRALSFFYGDKDDPSSSRLKKEFERRFPGAIHTYSLDDIDFNPSSVTIVTIGPQSLRIVMQSDFALKLNAELVAMYINREVFYAIASPLMLSQKKIGAIFNETSTESQFKLIHNLFGESLSVSVPLTYKTQKYRYEILKAAQAFNFEVSTPLIDARSNVTRSIAGTASSNVMLMMPDLDLYTPTNLSSILESCYRRGLPVIGFNPAIVQAGALATTCASNEEMAASLEWMLRPERGPLAPAHPVYWHSTYNEQIARSLNVVIPPNSPNAWPQEKTK